MLGPKPKESVPWGVSPSITFLFPYLALSFSRISLSLSLHNFPWPRLKYAGQVDKNKRRGGVGKEK